MSFKAKLVLIVIFAVVAPLLSTLVTTHILSDETKKVALVEAEKLADADLDHVLGDPPRRCSISREALPETL